MRILSFLAGVLLFLPARGQNITIDAGVIIRPLTGLENGINVDYLIDGDYGNTGISMPESLKKLHARLLRYPGGEKSDNYLFSAPPYLSSAPRMALTDTCYWPTNDPKFVQVNTAEKLCVPQVLDFDEFISLCTASGATPLVVVAYDAAYNTSPCAGKPTKQQLIENAVEWVRYANVRKGMKVKYWMIGNESWNDPVYNGRVTPAQYASDLKDFAMAMKGVDSSIKIIANGRKGWWQTILTSDAASYIDLLGFSEYPVFNYNNGYDYYRNHDMRLEEVDSAINAIKSYASEADKKRIRVFVSEYNSIDWGKEWSNQNNLGHALANFEMWGDMISKPEVEAACLWNTRWIDNAIQSQHLFDALDISGDLNATGTAMAVWGQNILSSLVSCTDSVNYIKSYASYDAGTQKLSIFLINKDYSPHRVNIAVHNFISRYAGSVWRFGGSSAADPFPVYERADSIYAQRDLENIDLPGTSVTVINLHAMHVVIDPREPLNKIYPNPFRDVIRIRMLSDFRGKIVARLIDNSGKIVMVRTFRIAPGNSNIEMTRLPSMPKGLYTLHINGSGAARSYKLVKF